MDNYEDLRSMSKENLITKYDQVATSTIDSLNFWRDEIFRREQEEYSLKIADLTCQMRNFTIAILILTILNAIFVVFQLCISKP